MPQAVDIEVKNNLIIEKRDLNVYHHVSRSAHIISPGSSIILPLGIAAEHDYLHISAVKGPGLLEKTCLADLPSWLDVEFNSCEKVTSISLAHRHDREGDRIVLKIPPGPPAWELKLTRPAKTAVNSRSTRKKEQVIIGERGE
jgi:hypothetical protein